MTAEQLAGWVIIGFLVIALRKVLAKIIAALLGIAAFLCTGIAFDGVVGMTAASPPSKTVLGLPPVKELIVAVIAVFVLGALCALVDSYAESD